jgi:hypothetical protein
MALAELWESDPEATVRGAAEGFYHADGCDTRKNGKVTKSRALEAVPGSGGIRAVVANNIGVSWQHIYRLQEKWPELKKAIDDEREALVDEAESALLRGIRERNTAMIIFTLKTLGRKRGWIERAGVDATVDKPEPVREWWIVDSPKRRLLGQAAA